jgi:hypothetical protein
MLTRRQRQIQEQEMLSLLLWCCQRASELASTGSLSAMSMQGKRDGKRYSKGMFSHEGKASTRETASS